MAGRLIRFIIILLIIIVLWKMWDIILPHDLDIIADKGLTRLSVEKSNLNSVASLPMVHSPPPPLQLQDDMGVEVNTLLLIYVYYEALCPDSKSFIRSQLTPTYGRLSEIMDVRLVPYGKASTHISDKGQITFHCQHGSLECEANKVHACVTHVVKDMDHQIRIIDCMIENNMNPENAGKKCTKKFGESWDEVKMCVSKKADEILQHMGILTNNLKPPVSFIPTVTIDGSQKEQPQVLKNLRRVLCKRYSGTHPVSGCS